MRAPRRDACIHPSGLRRKLLANGAEVIHGCPEGRSEDKKARLRERRMSELERARISQKNAFGMTSDLASVYGLRGLSMFGTAERREPRPPQSPRQHLQMNKPSKVSRPATPPRNAGVMPLARSSRKSCRFAAPVGARVQPDLKLDLRVRAMSTRRSGRTGRRSGRRPDHLLHAGRSPSGRTISSRRRSQKIRPMPFGNSCRTAKTS